MQRPLAAVMIPVVFSKGDDDEQGKGDSFSSTSTWSVCSESLLQICLSSAIICSCSNREAFDKNATRSQVLNGCQPFQWGGPTKYEIDKKNRRMSSFLLYWKRDRAKAKKLNAYGVGWSGEITKYEESFTGNRELQDSLLGRLDAGRCRQEHLWHSVPVVWCTFLHVYPVGTSDIYMCVQH